MDDQNHRWFNNKMDDAEKVERQKRQQEFKNRYAK